MAVQRKSIVAGGLILSLSLLAGCKLNPVEPLPTPPSACAGLKAQRLADLSANSLPPGRHLLWLDRATSFDAQLVGGGGGGGSGRAKGEWTWGGGGWAAEYKPPFAIKKLERGYYLIVVGQGGAGATGPNHSDPPADGAAGTETRISRCSSDVTIAQVSGGAGGRGDARTGGGDRADPGENYGTSTTDPAFGRGGVGGGKNENGQDAPGYGAGGGGQGRTEIQHTYHGGTGGKGYAKLFPVR
jgi:hypothetical protein